VNEHFNGVPGLTFSISENRDYGSFGVVAERLIDLVTNCKFGSHGESFRAQALPLLRPKYGFFAIDKTAGRFARLLTLDTDHCRTGANHIDSRAEFLT
jgi:hypothetical protein